MSLRQLPANRYPVLFILFLFFFFSGSNCLGFSQENDCESLIPERSSFGYKRQSNRCEGFYIPKLRGNLQVVSFTMGGDLKFSWDEKTLLTVSRIDKFQHSIRARAVSLQRNVFYQMDAVINRNESLIWPIGPYIYRRNIRPDQLGIYGWTGEEYDKIFSPVIVRQKDSQLPIEPIIILKIRTVLDLTHFRWNMIHSKGSICHSEPEIDKFQFFDGDMTAGNIIEIEVPYPKENIQFLCLEIQYRPDNRRWKSEILKIRF